jgi:hypothetical protein
MNMSDFWGSNISGKKTFFEAEILRVFYSLIDLSMVKISGRNTVI